MKFAAMEMQTNTPKTASKKTTTPLGEVFIRLVIWLVVFTLALASLVYVVVMIAWDLYADLELVRSVENLFPFLGDTFFVDCTNPQGLTHDQQSACLTEVGDQLTPVEQYAWEIAMAQ